MEEVAISTASERGAIAEVDEVNPVVKEAELVEFQELIHRVIIDPQLIRYIAVIVEKTRSHSSLYLGASPRASLWIMRASKAFAALEGRDFVTPEDIREVLYPVLVHRIILSPERK